MTPAAVDELLRQLTARAHMPAPLARTPIRVWRLSGVERLHLPSGRTAVFKYAVPPFTGEHHTLTALAAQGHPLPAVHAAHTIADLTGMILTDLGDPIRPAGEDDLVTAAVRLHTGSPVPGLPVLDAAALAALPARAAARLAHLRGEGHLTGADDLARILDTLCRAADARAAGADTPPFGPCHGELHATAVHIGVRGWHLLDLAMAFTGPGLLDLVAWRGLRPPPDPLATRALIERYVRAGGHSEALADRGGLPAQQWVLGWHRVHAAAWRLDHADPAGAGDLERVLRRQLAGAAALLAPTPPRAGTRFGRDPANTL